MSIDDKRRSGATSGSVGTGWTKKRVISKKIGITSFKYIRKGYVGGVLENSGYLSPDGH